jgi:methanogenic corrinoid protein MtbC1
MTDQAIIEAAARAMCDGMDEDCYEGWTSLPDADREPYRNFARKALAAITPLIRAQALEEAAKVAEAHKLGDNAMLTGTSIWAVHEGACIEIAAAVRALKEQQP